MIATYPERSSLVIFISAVTFPPRTKRSWFAFEFSNFSPLTSDFKEPYNHKVLKSILKCFRSNHFWIFICSNCCLLFSWLPRSKSLPSALCALGFFGTIKIVFYRSVDRNSALRLSRKLILIIRIDSISFAIRNLVYQLKVYRFFYIQSLHNNLFFVPSLNWFNRIVNIDNLPKMGSGDKFWSFGKLVVVWCSCNIRISSIYACVHNGSSYSCN